MSTLKSYHFFSVLSMEFSKTAYYSFIAQSGNGHVSQFEENGHFSPFALFNARDIVDLFLPFILAI